MDEKETVQSVYKPSPTLPQQTPRAPRFLIDQMHRAILLQGYTICVKLGVKKSKCENLLTNPLVKEHILPQTL